MTTTPIVTMSWDDGHPLDCKLADLLHRYGIRATFYIPRRSQLATLDERQVASLSEHFEIGGHTLDHLALTTLSSDEAAYTVSRRGLSISGALAACVKNAFFCRPNPLPGSVVQAECVSLPGKDVFYGKNMRSAAGHAQRWAALSCGQATSSALSIPQSG